MKVTLIRHTNEADLLAGEAAALCYNGKNPAKSLDVALDGGHESIIEHAVFTFKLEGISRVTLAQLTRHRLASFSVSSQRYIKIIDADFVTPQTIIDHAWQDNYKDEIMRDLTLYTLMVNDGVSYEDARYVLPQAFTCNVMLTMNARELRHFFSLRCCARAQWEIRHMARQMLALCQEAAPRLFADAGPGCVRGHCPEGAKGCGKGRRDAGRGKIMSRRAERQAKEARHEAPTMVLPVMMTKICYECKKSFDWYGECWVYQRRKKNGRREYACSYKCWRAEDHRKETKLRGEGYLTYGDKQKALYGNHC